MATLSNNNIALAIYLSSKDKSEQEQALFFKKIAQFLSRKRLLLQAPDILSRLDKIINEADGRIVVKLSSKEHLGEDTKKEIANILKERYAAQKIVFMESLNEKLLGGFKIEVRDEVIDLTVKNKIRKLQEYLTSSL
ncbi:MAG: F0F1 ATP synthase subunit delta [Candidatus Pacebacteria bacterium]|nr:F0F1 ATP synthase subunit delta [Candidatus Paceibacterota bacterium]